MKISKGLSVEGEELILDDDSSQQDLTTTGSLKDPDDDEGFVVAIDQALAKFVIVFVFVYL